MKYIISDNRGGIGNRLKGLISVLRLGKYLGREPLLFWPKNVLMGCEFNELFQNKINVLNEKEFQKFLNKDCVNYKEWLDNLYAKNEVLISYSWRFLMKPGEIPDNFSKEYPTIKGNNIDFEFNRIPLKIQKEILRYLKRLKPVREISKKVEVFSKKHNVKNLIGIHIRRTDFQSSPDGRGNISTDNLFFKKMDEILKVLPSQKFFLCTDSKETENIFKERYKSKIITYQKSEWDMSKSKASVSSLIDLLLLSKTKQIFGTYLSTFTEMAWWLGECKPKVEIIGDEKIKEKNNVIKILNKKDRGIRGIYKRVILLMNKYISRKNNA